MRTLTALTAFLGLCSAASAEIILDYSVFDGVPHGLADGVYGGPAEYDHQRIGIPSASGGGGGLGGTGAALYFNRKPPLTVGFQPGGPLDHTVIILLPGKQGDRTRGSGDGVVPLSDNTDASRMALSSLQGRYPFGTFGVGYAITINADGFGLFSFPDSLHSMFTQIGSYTGGIGPTGVHEASISGINSFISEFAVVYADSGVLYNESIPQQPYTGGANPGQQIGAASPADITRYCFFSDFVPGPSAVNLLGLGGIVLARRRRAASR